MTFLDAYALIALLVGERSASKVRELIEGGGAAITSVNLAEAIDVLGRRYRIDGERVRAAIATLTDRMVMVVSVDEMRAIRAGELRAEHYHRAASPLSLADCILLAAAGPDDRVVTADPHILAVAQRLSIATVDPS